MTESYDIVIVGGGTAGCVLANRLSADPRHRVALVEAGPDTPLDRTDPVLWDSYPIVAYFDPGHHWTDLRVRLQPAPPDGPDTRPLRRFEQARVMGGGSSINGMMANRGQPSDYDEWAALGADGWDWAGVLPFFRRLERDVDFEGPMHGQAGPLPIRRVPAIVGLPSPAPPPTRSSTPGSPTLKIRTKTSDRATSRSRSTISTTGASRPRRPTSTPGRADGRT